MTSRNKHRERSRKSRRQQAITMDAVRRNSYTNMMVKMARANYSEGRIKRLIASFMSHVKQPRESEGERDEKA